MVLPTTQFFGAIASVMTTVELMEWVVFSEKGGFYMGFAQEAGQVK
mgnify:CR=1 FL=1